MPTRSVRRFKYFLLFLLPITLSACVVLPKAADKPTHDNCELFTQELDLEMNTTLADTIFGGNSSPRLSSTDDLAAFAAVVAAVPAVTFIVSGSIVLIGNTVHWLEAQGSCEDSYIKTRLASYFNELEVDKTKQSKQSN